MAATEPFKVQAVDTVEINYTGTKNFTNAFIEADLLEKQNARILYCASMVSCMSMKQMSEQDQNIFKKSAEDMTIEQLDEVVEEFLELARNYSEADEKAEKPLAKYRKSAYGMSKIFVRAMCHIYSRKFPQFLQFSYCPGWCKSDMAGWERPPRTAAQGAEITYLLGKSEDKAVLEKNGGFFKNDDEFHEWGN